MSDEYRACAVGPDGRILLRIDLVCEDDDAAKERAAQLVEGHAIELWKGDKLLARFEPLQ
jgi:hypothetical protein